MVDNKITILVCRECGGNTRFTTSDDSFGRDLFEEHFKNDHGRECLGWMDVYRLRLDNSPGPDFEMLLLAGAQIEFKIIGRPAP